MNKMAVSKQDITNYMISVLAKETGHNPANIDIEKSFFKYGIDSINAVYLLELIESHFNVELNPLYFWDFPTIESLAAQIHKENFRS